MKPRDVPCPDCIAEAGDDCVAFGLPPRTRPMWGFHPRRTEAARRATEAEQPEA